MLQRGGVEDDLWPVVLEDGLQCLLVTDVAEDDVIRVQEPLP